MIWPDGLTADLDFASEWTTPLPKTIPPGSSEVIKMWGNGHKWRGMTPEGKLELQPNQKSAEATVVVKFNTEYIAKKKITFIVKRD